MLAIKDKQFTIEDLENSKFGKKYFSTNSSDQ